MFKQETSLLICSRKINKMDNECSTSFYCDLYSLEITETWYPWLKQHPFPFPWALSTCLFHFLQTWPCLNLFTHLFIVCLSSKRKLLKLKNHLSYSTSYPQYLKLCLAHTGCSANILLTDWLNVVFSFFDLQTLHPPEYKIQKGSDLDSCSHDIFHT